MNKFYGTSLLMLGFFLSVNCFSGDDKEVVLRFYILDNQPVLIEEDDEVESKALDSDFRTDFNEFLALYKVIKKVEESDMLYFLKNKDALSTNDTIRSWYTEAQKLHQSLKNYMENEMVFVYNKLVVFKKLIDACIANPCDDAKLKEIESIKPRLKAFLNEIQKVAMRFAFVVTNMKQKA